MAGPLYDRYISRFCDKTASSRKEKKELQLRGRRYFISVVSENKNEIYGDFARDILFFVWYSSHTRFVSTLKQTVHDRLSDLWGQWILVSLRKRKTTGNRKVNVPILYWKQNREDWRFGTSKVWSWRKNEREIIYKIHGRNGGRAVDTSKRRRKGRYREEGSTRQMRKGK